jgi:hypothetical protein
MWTRSMTRRGLFLIHFSAVDHGGQCWRVVSFTRDMDAHFLDPDKNEARHGSLNAASS